jgi:hypothetical protein
MVVDVHLLHRQLVVRAPTYIFRRKRLSVDRRDQRRVWPGSLPVGPSAKSIIATAIVKRTERKIIVLSWQSALWAADISASRVCVCLVEVSSIHVESRRLCLTSALEF